MSKNTIAIRPYIEGQAENMGLEDYNMVVFEGTKHMEQLTCIERNGEIHYITGLNEFAPEVQMIKDTNKKEARIKAIRTAVSELERELGFNEVDPKDKNFWEKVKTLHPKNKQFWEKISIAAGNSAEFLDASKAEHKLLIHAIEAGGFSMIAKSYEDAKTMQKPPKFYLDKQIETAGIKVELKKLKNKAISLLDELSEKQPKKLFYIVKLLDVYSPQYKNSTPEDNIYEVIDEILSGKGVSKDNNVRKGLNSFIELTEQSIEDLKIKCLVKDAMSLKKITTKADKNLYYSNTFIGRNSEDALEFFKDPSNDDLLTKIDEEIEEFWNT